MAKTRAHLYISGLVQGVWFRGTTQDEARRLGVKGWVRNLYDGRVEVVAEGEEEAVENLIRWCHKGPRGARITNVEVIREQYKGEFDTFSILYRY